MTTEDMINSGWEPVHTEEDWRSFLYANCDDYMQWCCDLIEDKQTAETRYEYMASHDPNMPEESGWKIYRRKLPTGEKDA